MHSPSLISTLIEAAIDNYGIMNENVINDYDNGLVEVIERRMAMDAETQVNSISFNKEPAKAM